MKVYQNGKEVKDAKVTYSPAGVPVNVVVEGVNYDASAYELKEDKTVKKTKADDGEVMTAKDSKKGK